MIIVGFCVLGLGLIVFKTVAENRRQRTRETQIAPITEPKLSAVASEGNDASKGLWLTLRARGFEVKEMIIPAGDYLVVIENATGLDRFGVRVARGNGERLHQVRLPPLKKEWRQTINFTPGDYRVSEIDHRDWTCRIKVTAR